MLLLSICSHDGVSIIITQLYCAVPMVNINNLCFPSHMSYQNYRFSDLSVLECLYLCGGWRRPTGVYQDNNVYNNNLNIKSCPFKFGFARLIFWNYRKKGELDSIAKILPLR